MARSKRALALLAAAAAVSATTSLAGCSLLTATAPVHTPTALESCATGHTWALDVEALAPVATAAMHEHTLNVQVVVEGTQQLTWDTDFKMTFDTDLTFRGVIDGDYAPGYEEQYTVKGQSEGFAYFSGETAVPRNWSEDDLDTEITATQDGAPAADIIYPWIVLWTDDTVGLTVTCSAEQLVLAGRQSPLSWTFNRVS